MKETRLRFVSCQPVLFACVVSVMQSAIADDGAKSQTFIKSGRAIGMHVKSSQWMQKERFVEGSGVGNTLIANRTIERGDFHIRARLRMLKQEASAASFFLGRNHFGFEGAKRTIFVNGPIFGRLKLLGPSIEVFRRGDWIEFEVVRKGNTIDFVINDKKIISTKSDAAGFDRLGFSPHRSTMQVSEFSVEGITREVPAPMSKSYMIPTLDLADQKHRQVIVDREKGQYLGHPTTVLLEDNKTIIVVYPKGHGRGSIVMKRSNDAGLTWSDRLPTPKSWASSREVPTIHRVIDASGKKRLILFSGLYPIRMAVSEDDGMTWSELKPIGKFGGIVTMGCVFDVRTKPGHYVALFHDDGRFLRGGKNNRNGSPAGTASGFDVFKTVSSDGGLTWSEPSIIANHPVAHLCEPGVIRSPDGKQLAVLLRENSRRLNSFVIFSNDEGKTWTKPRELPAALTGDRHTGKYAPDGRLFISFRDTTHVSPTKGDWVAWVGTYEDIIKGREGQYRVRLMDNHKGGDCAYPAVDRLPDGTFVTTTYGHWVAGEAPFIVSVRLKLSELDRLAKQ